MRLEDIFIKQIIWVEVRKNNTYKSLHFVSKNTNMKLSTVVMMEFLFIISTITANPISKGKINTFYY